MNLIKIREDLHRIPELGFQEKKTQAYILGLFSKENALKVHLFAFPGILLEYHHGSGPYVLFRADMDALPIEEDTNCEFSSQHPGLMHACGHDVHMTILIGLMKRVLEANLKSNLLFLFQPAEEGRGGAERIIKTGVLNNFKIKAAYALHVNGSLPLGVIASRQGIFFANAHEVHVLFHGRSAHIAFPEQGRNALAAGVMFYSQFKQRLAQEFPVAGEVTCEFGKMQAGTVMNAIAAECSLEGSIRTYQDKHMDFICRLIEVTAAQAAEAYDLKSEVIYKAYYRHVYNNPTLVEQLKRVVQEIAFSYQETERVFTGEDFGFFTHLYPGLLFWLGTDTGEKQGLHSSKFLPSAESIDIGVETFWYLINRGE